jgi:ABC-type transport system substrate-binding protein
MHNRLLRPKYLILMPLLVALAIAVACGGATTPKPAAGPTSAPAATKTPEAGTIAPTAVPKATAQPTAKSAAVLVRESPLALAAAHNEKPRYGGKFLAAEWEPISFYDMHQTSFGGVGIITAPAYNGLLATSPYDPLALEIIPDLARTWELAEGGKRVTFHLAQGVRWHDGVAFSSQDVKFTVDRIMNPPKGMVSPRRGVFTAVIESVEAPDPNTVVINGKGPSPLVVGLFANGWQAIIPKHIAEKDPVEAMKTTVMGTGAFKLKEKPTTTLWRYERNRDYFEKDLPYLDEIDYHIIQDVQTLAAAILSQRAYWTDPIYGPTLRPRGG